MKSVTLILLVAIMALYNVEAIINIEEVQKACGGSHFEEDCAASISSKLGPEVNASEISLASITVLEERARACLDEARKLESQTPEVSQSGPLWDAIREYETVLDSCNKAREAFKARDREQMRSALSDAYKASGHVTDSHEQQTEQLKVLNTNLAMAAQSAFTVVPETLY